MTHPEKQRNQLHQFYIDYPQFAPKDLPDGGAMNNFVSIFIFLLTLWVTAAYTADWFNWHVAKSCFDLAISLVLFADSSYLVNINDELKTVTNVSIHANFIGPDGGSQL